MKKLISILVAFAMMAVLSITAFAETGLDNNNKTINDGTAANPADIAVKKVLSIADGVTVPNTTYKFNVALSKKPTPAEGETAVADPTGFATEVSTTVTRDTNEGANLATASGVTGEIFTNAVFHGTGIYEFTVTEFAPTDATAAATYLGGTADQYTVSKDGTVVTVIKKTVNGEETKEETFIFNTETNTLVVAVAYDEVTETYYINSIAVKDPTGAKKTIIETDDGFAFEVENNKYSVRYEGKDMLTVKKNVTGEGASQTKKFVFHVGVTKPANSTATAYLGQVYDAENNPVGDPISFAVDGTTKPVELAHNWTLKFDNLDAGATYTAIEDDYSAIGYKASNEVETAALISDQGASATVTNTYDETKDETKTGITMNNLPFIVLALVALGGLVAYVVVRRRNADEA